MKSFVLSLVLCIAGLAAKSQSMDKLLGFLKQRKIDSVMKYSALPFSINVGSEGDEIDIRDAASLRKRLLLLFKYEYFDGLFKGKKIKSKENMIIFETRTIDDNGELLSESQSIFDFQKLKGGGYRLKRIMMAG